MIEEVDKLKEDADNTAQNSNKVIGRPFPPGVSGNPAGRPKRSWSIKDKIWQKFEDDPEALKVFIEELLVKYKGLVWTMLEGRPPQDLNLGNADDLPFNIKIVKEDGTDDKTIRPTV